MRFPVHPTDRRIAAVPRANAAALLDAPLPGSPTAEEAALRVAVDALYDAFASHLSPHDMEHCGHCVADEEVCRLHARTFRKVFWEDFGRYPFKAVTTWGSEDDLRHFLPRLCELLVYAQAAEHEVRPCRPPADADGYAPMDVEDLLGKIDYALGPTWPPPKGNALQGFFVARLRQLFARAPGQPSGGDWGRAGRLRRRRRRRRPDPRLRSTPSPRST